MKKIIILIIIITLLSVSSINAAKINIKENYDKEETLIAKVTGDFEEKLLKENIYLFRDFERIPIDIKEVLKINNNYFFYTSLKSKKGNYSLKIKDTFYWNKGHITNEDLIQNFTITNKTTDFIINKGVIKTNNDFSIEITNLKNEDINIKLIQNITQENSGWFGDSSNEKEINVNAGDIKNIDFNINNNLTNTSSNYYEIKLETENTQYIIPVYIEEDEEKNKTISSEKELEFNPNQLDVFVLINSSEYNKTIKLKNTGKEKIENIDLKVSKNLMELITLSKYQIKNLDSDSSEEIIIYINTNASSGITSGYITANSNLSTQKSIKINLNYTKDLINKSYENENFSSEIDNTCESVNGSICSDNEKCIGDIEQKEEGNCCIGECVEKEQESNIGQKIIGYFLLLCIIIFIAWFFIKRFNITKRKTNLIETAKKGIFSKK